uniref:Uncharacterized protein n=1 Tax=Amphimedon queenslandica TaxID=400682 RepID=A0A1X7UZL2_AMPQE
MRAITDCFSKCTEQTGHKQNSVWGTLIVKDAPLWTPAGDETHLDAFRKKINEKYDLHLGYLPNSSTALEAMLTTAASIGAIRSSTSPDFHSTGVLDRFKQIKPKVIFSVEAV